MQQDSLSNKFVFFNDGDQTPDDKKKLGKTRGIYGKQCDSFNELKTLVSSTMSKGGGGDCAENNIEALLFANNMFPDTDTIIMLADNWAPIKDLKLSHLLKKPVKIIVCGVQDNIINLDYLNLARITNGSLHTMEADFYNLARLHDAEMISIGNRKYKIVSGTFTEVATM